MIKFSNYFPSWEEKHSKKENCFLMKSLVEQKSKSAVHPWNSLQAQSFYSWLLSRAKIVENHFIWKSELLVLGTKVLWDFQALFALSSNMLKTFFCQSHDPKRNKHLKKNEINFKAFGNFPRGFEMNENWVDGRTKAETRSIILSYGVTLLYAHIINQRFSLFCIFELFSKKHHQHYHLKTSLKYTRSWNLTTLLWCDFAWISLFSSNQIEL